MSNNVRLWGKAVCAAMLLALAKEGFCVTHRRGSHIYLTDEERKHKVTVPRHDPVMTGTLLSTIEQSGLTTDEFLKLLD